VSAAGLSGLPLLRALDPAARERLEDCLERTQLAPRSALFREGDESDGVIWIAGGRIRAWSSRDEPVELGRGALIGAISLVVAGKRRFSADAVAPTQVLKLRRAAFQELVQRAPRVACQLLAALLADQAELFEEALNELASRARP